METFASATTGSTVFCKLRRAAVEAVHVDRGLDPGSQVELLGRALVGRPGALGGEDFRAASQLAPARDLLVARPDDPGAQRLGQASVARAGRPRAPASARASRSAPLRRRARSAGRARRFDPDVEVAMPARRDVEHGQAGREQVPVEDMQASPPRSSASRKSTIEWPPDSSSPSQVNRTFTGASPPPPAARAPSAGGRAGPCRRRRRARRASRPARSARTAALSQSSSGASGWTSKCP